MIQPNELRLLNWVKYDNRYFQIHSIAYVFPTLNTDEFGIGVVDYNNIQPVELTSDILEAAGCKKDVIDGWNLWINGNLFVIRKLISLNGYTLSVGDYCLCDMEYLHTFQNAYYCLTGEELQIDITKLNKEK